jgi:hypothetical protein
VNAIDGPPSVGSRKSPPFAIATRARHITWRRRRSCCLIACRRCRASLWSLSWTTAQRAESSQARVVFSFRSLVARLTQPSSLYSPGQLPGASGEQGPGQAEACGLAGHGAPVAEPAAQRQPGAAHAIQRRRVRVLPRARRVAGAERGSGVAPRGTSARCGPRALPFRSMAWRLTHATPLCRCGQAAPETHCQEQLPGELPCEGDGGAVCGCS